MKRILFAAPALLFALVSAPVAAQTADGAVCYSAEVTVTGGAGGVPSVPLMDNATGFTCHSPTPYNIRQLAQGGWKIVQASTVTTSSVVNSNGTSTTKFRHMLILQR